MRDRRQHRLLRRRRPQTLAWPFFAVAQGGFLKSGGVFIKGGSRVLSMKLAKIVMNVGRAGAARPRSGRRRYRRRRPPDRVRHVDSKSRGDAERIEATAGARQLRAERAGADAAPRRAGEDRAGLRRARPLSISLFSAHFGLSEPPAEFGLDRYSLDASCRSG